MILFLLAMFILFMLIMDLGKKAKLLTVQDMKKILEVILLKEAITEKEIIELDSKKNI